MYVSDSLNLLTNIVLKAIAGDNAGTVDMRYADIVAPKINKEPEKEETAEDIITRLTNKIKGGTE